MDCELWIVDVVVLFVVVVVVVVVVLFVLGFLVLFVLRAATDIMMCIKQKMR